MDYNIKSLRAQAATLQHPPALAGTKISFEEGETLRIGRGCKYTTSFFKILCEEVGLKVVASHYDEFGYFAMQEMVLEDVFTDARSQMQVRAA